jgi:hypothetical protein
VRAILLTLLTVAPLIPAQRISAGLIGGGAATDDFPDQTLPSIGPSPNFNFFSPSKSYAVGALVELRLPLHLSVEADGMYHPLAYAESQSYTDPSGKGDLTHPSVGVVTWEFPVLAKYRFSFPAVKPFVEAGPSFRTSGNLNATAPSNHGITAGAGVEAHLLRLKIAPQIRYTRWAADHPSPPWAITNPNQVEILVSMSF